MRYLVVLSGVVDIDAEPVVLIVEDESVAILVIESVPIVVDEVFVSSAFLLLEQAEARAMMEQANSTDLVMVFISRSMLVGLTKSGYSR